MFFPLPRGRDDGCTITSGTLAVAVAVGVAVAVAVATAVVVAVAVAVAVTVTVAVTEGSGSGVSAVPVVVGSGFSGVVRCVPHATSMAGVSIAALMTERTTSLIGERPWYPMTEDYHHLTRESLRFRGESLTSHTNGSTSA